MVNFLVALVFSVILFVIFSQWILIFLPLEFYKSIVGQFYIIIYHFLASLLCFSYLQSIRTKPGGPPVNWTPEGKTKEDLNQIIEYYKNNPHLSSRKNQSYSDTTETGLVRKQQHKYCLKCSRFKPERTHHCKYCNQCVLKQDHHCPWIDNCTGFRNQKFFIQFLFYVVIVISLTTLVMIVTGFYVLNKDLDLNLENNRDSQSSQFTYLLADPFITILYIFNFSIIIPVFLGVSGLFYYQVDFLLRNFTSVERFERKSENRLAKRNGLKYRWKYDRGWKKNFKEVFGESKLYWFLPIGVPKSDGLNWINVKIEDISDSDSDDNGQLLMKTYGNSTSDVYNV